MATINVVTSDDPALGRGVLDIRPIIAPKPSGGDDTAVLKALLDDAQLNSGTLVLQEGTYVADLVTQRLDTQPRIVGMGASHTRLDGSVRFLGTSDTVMPGFIGGMSLVGSHGSDVALEFNGCIDVHFDDLWIEGTYAVGVLFHNELADHFSELNNGAVRIGRYCTLAVEYRNTAGHKSFHGSGLLEGSFIQQNPTENHLVYVGAGCRPYNAPMTMRCWMRSDSFPVFENDGDPRSQFYGNLCVEAGGFFNLPEPVNLLMAGGSTVTYYSGSLSTNFGGSTVELTGDIEYGSFIVSNNIRGKGGSVYIDKTGSTGHVGLVGGTVIEYLDFANSVTNVLIENGVNFPVIAADGDADNVHLSLRPKGNAWLRLAADDAANSPVLYAESPATNTNLILKTKGTGRTYLQNGSGTEAIVTDWSNLTGKPYAANPTGVAETDVANLNAAVATAKANVSRLYIPGGVYALDETIDLGREAGAGYQPGFNMEGQGRNATYFYVADDVSGIALSNLGVNDAGVDWMQYGDVGAFTIEYPNLQHRDNVESWAFGTDSGVSHSVFHEILVNNAFNGIYTVDQYIAPSTQPAFQNSWRDLRIFNCWKGLILDGDTSGCLIENVYVSAPSRPSMLVMVDSWGLGNQFLRLNTEHANVRDVIFDSILGSNVSITGWHMEGLAISTAGQACYAGNGRGFDRPTGAPSRHSWYATTGQGHQSINNWSVDSNFMGPHLVEPYGLTRSANTCRINFLYMPSSLRELGGLGMEVGDNIFIEGADTGTSNEYNGTHVVTAVSTTPSTTPWLEFEIASGSPASPADVQTGCDAIAVNIGDAVLYSIPIIQANGSASSVTVDGLHIRDMKITGSTPSRRQNMVRALNGGGTAVQVSFKNINNGSQQYANGGWPKQASVIGAQLDSNVVEFWFLNKHHLKNSDSIRVTDSGVGVDGLYTGGTITSPYSVTYPLVGVDFGRTGINATAVRNTLSISDVARSDNYTTLTTVEDTTLSGGYESGEGLQVSVVCVEDVSFSVVNAQVLGVPDAHTILIRNEGVNVSSKVQTGSVMIIDQPFGGFSFDESTQNGAVLMEFGEIDDYCTVSPPLTIAAETTTDLRLLNLNRADANKDVVEIVGVQGLDPLCTVTGYVYGWNQVLLQATNHSASTVALGSIVVHYRIVRK